MLVGNFARASVLMTPYCLAPARVLGKIVFSTAYGTAEKYKNETSRELYLVIHPRMSTDRNSCVFHDPNIA